MTKFEFIIQGIISRLNKIIDEACNHLPKDAKQTLQDDISFYVIKELENLNEK